MGKGLKKKFSEDLRKKILEAELKNDKEIINDINKLVLASEYCKLKSEDKVVLLKKRLSSCVMHGKKAHYKKVTSALITVLLEIKTQLDFNQLLYVSK